MTAATRRGAWWRRRRLASAQASTRPPMDTSHGEKLLAAESESGVVEHGIGGPRCRPRRIEVCGRDRLDPRGSRPASAQHLAGEAVPGRRALVRDVEEAAAAGRAPSRRPSRPSRSPSVGLPRWSSTKRSGPPAAEAKDRLHHVAARLVRTPRPCGRSCAPSSSSRSPPSLERPYTDNGFGPSHSMYGRSRRRRRRSRSTGSRGARRRGGRPRRHAECRGQLTP